MPRYRKKPVIIEAIKWTGHNYEEILAFCGETKVSLEQIIDGFYRQTFCIIKTLEGNIKAVKDDYIIKGVQGEFYPCKPDIFEQTYELVKEDQEDDQEKNFKTYMHINNGGVTVDFDINNDLGVLVMKINSSHFGSKTNAMEIYTDYNSIKAIRDNLNKFLEYTKDVNLKYNCPIASINE